MKNLIFTLIIIVAFSLNMSGKGIDVETARKAAINVCILYNPVEKSLSDLNLTLTRTFKSDTETPLFYVFNINETEGFIIISADDIAKPIIGFSFEGPFPSGELIPSFRFWMNNYADQIDNAIKNNLQPHPDAAAEWQEVLTNSPKKKDVQMIQPLLLTLWNQDDPYNELCPADAVGPDGHVYVGCVALAMAQVIKYYNYPTTGTGSNTLYNWENGGYGTLTVNFAAQTYNYNNMPNSLSASNTELAKLCYHSAIAVDMYFGPDGSASMTEKIVTALETYFKYATACNYKSKISYTETSWKNMIKAQIDAKKPMCYSGSDATGGHAWNIDGYIGETFHMNWGWGGSANGYYDIASQTAGGYTFNQNFGGVFDIYPASGYPENCTSTPKLISGAEGTFNDGSGNQNYDSNKDCLYLIQPACGEKIQLNFDVMSLGSGDFVYVYDGDNTGSPLLATYSSANIPAANAYLYSYTGAILIRFTTDASSVAEGWYASYKVTYCGGTQIFTTPSGTVTDGSGICEYKNSAICTFDLNPTNVGTFDLNFTEFLFPSSDTNDYIMIYKNSMSTQNLLGKWHGLNVPTTMNIQATRLYIRFKSSVSITGGGFTVLYNATVDIPRNSDNLSQILLFPNPSEKDALISLDAAQTTDITITILDITGKTIQQYILPVEKGHNYLPVSVENPGVYFVNLQNSTDIVTLKFIKQ